MTEIRNAFWLASCLFRFFCQFGRFRFDTVELILPYGYFGKSGTMHVRSLSFKAFESFSSFWKSPQPAYVRGWPSIT